MNICIKYLNHECKKCNGSDKGCVNYDPIDLVQVAAAVLNLRSDMPIPRKRGVMSLMTNRRGI